LTDSAYLKNLIRDLPDYPKPGILFRDITPLLAHAEGFHKAIMAMAEPFRTNPPDLIAGTEARGFIFGPAVALELGAGFIPVRKPGKLPYKTFSRSYELEYGEDRLEVHKDAVKPGQKVLLVDDLLATGGTIAATRDLIEDCGGLVIGCSFLIELSFLNGRKVIGEDIPVYAPICYTGED
jgi:adenine phosphoribosyltransferase